MDIIDEVSYRWEVEDDKFMPEEIRQAYCNLFDSTNKDAMLVARHLVLFCKWLDQTEYNDPIVESKMNSLRGVIREVKKQLNMPRIEVNQGDMNE